MRFFSAVLDRLSRPEKNMAASSSTTPPPALPDHERRQLAEAQERIPRKWEAFDRMLAEHAKADAFLHGHQR